MYRVLAQNFGGVCHLRQKLYRSRESHVGLCRSSALLPVIELSRQSGPPLYSTTIISLSPLWRLLALILLGFSALWIMARNKNDEDDDEMHSRTGVLTADQLHAAISALMLGSREDIGRMDTHSFKLLPFTAVSYAWCDVGNIHRIISSQSTLVNSISFFNRDFL
jgi:hypothetical protein